MVHFIQVRSFSPSRFVFNCQGRDHKIHTLMIIRVECKYVGVWLCGCILCHTKFTDAA